MLIDTANSFYRITFIALAGMLLAPFAIAAADIEEIVVTAQKREESVQEVPVSVTVFDASDIERYRFERSQDFAAQTANLQIEELFGFSSARVSMRGIVNGDFSPISNVAVTVHSDGVVLNNLASHGFAMFDLERIEVLRGPQGTLYGRNATAGSLNFISAGPTEEFNGYGRFTYGEYDQIRFEGAVSGAIVADKVLGRLAIVKNERDGYVRNIFDGSDTPKADDYAVRGMLKFLINEDIELDVKLQYGESRGESILFHSDIDPNPINGLPNPGPASGWEVINLNRTNRPENVDALDLAATLNWDLGSFVLTSVTGYGENDRLEFNDDDNTSDTFLDEYFGHNQSQFTQELRLTSSGEQRFRWIGGAFYLTEDVQSSTVFDFTGLFFDPNPANGYANLAVFDQQLESWAVFGHTDYDLTDRLTLTAALRWTEDRKDIDGSMSDCLFFDRTTTTLDQLTTAFPDCSGVPLGTLVRSDTWSEWSGRVAIDFAVTDDILVYASWSRGFKGGGYNGSPALSTDLNVVGSETLIAYEIGAKTQWFDNRLVLNVGGFFYDYEDWQLFSFVPAVGGPGFATFLINVPKAEMYGLEAELQAEPVDGLHIRLGVGLLDTKFVNFVEADGRSHNGNETPRSPNNFNGLVQYEFSLGNWGTVTPQLDWNYLSSYFTDFDESVVVDGFWRINARLTWRDMSERWAVTVFMEDLEGELDAVSRTEPLLVGSHTVVITERPPAWGITVGYEF